MRGIVGRHATSILSGLNVGNFQLWAGDKTPGRRPGLMGRDATFNIQRSTFNFEVGESGMGDSVMIRGIGEAVCDERFRGCGFCR
jgi:hypothetical protein